MSLIIRRLDVRRHTSSAITQAEATTIIQGASNIMNQCRVNLFLNGNVGTFATGNGTINSQADYQAVCASRLRNLNRQVHVVNQINWCGTIGTNIGGCSDTPGLCMILVRVAANIESVVWAHEFGHTYGLNHRNDVNALMAPVAAPGNTQLNGNECNALRGGARIMESYPSNYPLSRPDIKEFVHAQYHRGVPFNKASEFNVGDLTYLEALLKVQSEELYWTNIVTVIGIIGTRHSTAILVSFIQSTGGGSLDEFRARRAAIISLGYVVNKSHDEDALSFLKAALDRAHWSKEFAGRGSRFHANVDDFVTDMTTAAILGLALTGQTEGGDILYSLRSSADTKERAAAGTGPLLGTIEEALIANAFIGAEGLSAYYAQSRKGSDCSGCS